jgi:hypothetical protein
MISFTLKSGEERGMPKSIILLSIGDILAYFKNQENMKFLIGIGHVNRVDLLVKAVNSIPSLWKNAVIIDNSPNMSLAEAAGLQNSVPIYAPPFPFTLTQTMNFLHRIAAELNCDSVLFMHNDAEAQAGTPENFMAVLNHLQKYDIRWGAIFTNHHTIVAYNMAAVRQVGPWDTVFPHYLADHDYHRRLKLAGYALVDSGLPVHHHNGGSNTINSDVHLKEMNDLTFPLYEAYYHSKWGGKVGEEYYPLLFNQFPLNPITNYLGYISPR